MIIQRKLISWVLAPLGKLMDHFSGKTREGIFVAAGLLLFALYFLNGAGKLSFYPYLCHYAAGCLCVGLMILAVLRSDIQPVRFSPVLMGLWLAVGVLITVSALRFNTDWLSDGLIYLVACPVAFIVWGNLDYRKFLALLSRTGIFSFLIYLVVSAVFYPVGSRQYSSLFGNVNGAGQYLCLVFCCLLVEAFRRHTHRWKQIAVVVLLGLCTGLMYYTNSRTGQLSILCAGIFTSVLYLLQEKKDFKARLLRHVLPVLLSVIIFLPGTLYIFRGVEAAKTAVSEFSSHSQQTDTPASAAQPDSTEQQGSFSTFQEVNQQKTDTAGKTADQVSTGRLSIWKVYWERVKLFGNGEEERFWVESRDTYYSTAHMMPLTFAFRHGLICAVLYLLFNLLAGLKSVKFAWGRKEEPYALMPLAVTIAFGVCSMLESIGTPFLYMITMYYYFCQTPLITQEKNGVYPRKPPQCHTSSGKPGNK